MKIKHFTIGFITCLLLFVVTGSVYKDSILKNDYYVAKPAQAFQSVNTPPMPEVMLFAGEEIPFDFPDAKERFERELIRNCFYHSSTITFIKRSRRFFPIIEPILAEYNIPQDFKYLAVAESGLANAVSPASAKGLWQFLKGTGQEYGLEVSSTVDERYHYEKATHAACKYIKHLHKKFDSWTLAAAAYNMGPSGLKRAMDRQKETSYFHLNLNSETARYVYRIAAIKQLMSNPEMYGFFVKEEEKYMPYNNYSELELQTPRIDSLGLFAHKHNMSYRELKIYNPWMRDVKLEGKSGKKYVVKIKH